jgi:urease accessory protein
MGIPELEMIEGYLYGWVANQLSAAVRLVPLGPTTAQKIQQQLLPLISAQASVLRDQDPKMLWSGGAGAGLAQLAHAELYSRLFRS